MAHETESKMIQRVKTENMKSHIVDVANTQEKCKLKPAVREVFWFYRSGLSFITCVRTKRDLNQVDTTFHVKLVI